MSLLPLYLGIIRQGDGHLSHVSSLSFSPGGDAYAGKCSALGFQVSSHAHALPFLCIFATEGQLKGHHP